MDKLKYTQAKGERWYFVRRRGQRVLWTPLPGNPHEDAEAERAYWRLRSGKSAAAETSRFTMSSLIESYRQSHRFQRVKASTQKGYGTTLARIEKRQGDQDFRRYDRPAMIDLRDKIAAALSPREADKVIVMHSNLFEHAIDKGWRRDNPAKGVERVNKAAPHEPWPQWAMDGFERHADPQTRLIYEMLLGLAQRLTDTLRIRWDDEEDGGFWVTQQKTGTRLWVEPTERLRAYLDDVPRTLSTITAGPDGKPIDRHRAQKLLSNVRPLYGGQAYVWHGLRYNATAEISDQTDEVIGAVTGHRSPSMVRKYAGPTRQKRLAKRARNRNRTN